MTCVSNSYYNTKSKFHCPNSGMLFVQLKPIIILNAYSNVILTYKKHDGREFEFLMLDLGRHRSGRCMRPVRILWAECACLWSDCNYKFKGRLSFTLIHSERKIPRCCCACSTMRDSSTSFPLTAYIPLVIKTQYAFFLFMYEVRTASVV
jgi:hypothetical protein